MTKIISVHRLKLLMRISCNLCSNYLVSCFHRCKDGTVVYPKPNLPSNPAYNHAVEVMSTEELEDLSSDPDGMRMQALLVRERVLGPAHPDTSYYIR